MWLKLRHGHLAHSIIYFFYVPKRFALLFLGSVFESWWFLSSWGYLWIKLKSLGAPID